LSVIENNAIYTAASMYYLQKNMHLIKLVLDNHLKYSLFS